jgi:hypothetical protein
MGNHYSKRKTSSLKAAVYGALVFDLDMLIAQWIFVQPKTYHNIFIDFLLSTIGLLGYFLSIPIEAIRENFIRNSDKLMPFVTYAATSIIGACVFVFVQIAWRSIMGKNDHESIK